eukprot:m.189586 g.189586  ORF g.189586 m.189586 type:complete len:209 (+) comp18211_c1_seq2:3621-4247(+)
MASLNHGQTAQARTAWCCLSVGCHFRCLLRAWTVKSMPFQHAAPTKQQAALASSKFSLIALPTVVIGANATSVPTVPNAAIDAGCDDTGRTAALGLAVVAWLLVGCLGLVGGWLLWQYHRAPASMRRKKFAAKAAFHNPAFSRDVRKSAATAKPTISGPTEFRHVASGAQGAEAGATPTPMQHRGTKAARAATVVPPRRAARGDKNIT